MVNILVYLKKFLSGVKKEAKEKPSLITLSLLLISIPAAYAINSIATIVFVVSCLFFYKRNTFKWYFYLIIPIALYIVMLLSLSWTISYSDTIRALSTELPLITIPIAFLCITPFNKNQVNTIIRFYSNSIVLYSIYYITRAIIRYSQSNDISVFYYHELATYKTNAIYASVYTIVAVFYFITKNKKSFYDKAAIFLLTGFIFLLSSKNIIMVYIILLFIYYMFFNAISLNKKILRLFLFIIPLLSVVIAVPKIRHRFLIEVQTAFTEKTLNTETKNTNIYNISIKEAWQKEQFTSNDYFPGTAFRVYQARIFKEMLMEENIFLTGYGLKASGEKIKQKAVEHKIHPGYGNFNFHNQYIQAFAEVGFFGLLLLLIMLTINLRNAIKSKDFIHITFAFLMISLFLTESFLWRQKGVIFFIALYCLFNSALISAEQKKAE
jgi:O-antigen ligase